MCEMIFTILRAISMFTTHFSTFVQIYIIVILLHCHVERDDSSLEMSLHVYLD